MFHTVAYLFVGTPRQIPYFSALPFWQTPQKIIWYLMSNLYLSTLSLSLSGLFCDSQSLQWSPRFSSPSIQKLVKFLPQSPRLYLCKYSRSNSMIYVNTIGVTDENIRDLKPKQQLNTFWIPDTKKQRDNVCCFKLSVGINSYTIIIHILSGFQCM